MKTLQRDTFPIKMAFSVTVNKGEGQTLKHVGIYLPSPIFPLVSCMWHFNLPLHITSLEQICKMLDSELRVTDWARLTLYIEKCF